MEKVRSFGTTSSRNVQAFLFLLLGVLLLVPSIALADATYPAEEAANGTTVVTVGLPGTYDRGSDAAVIAAINQYRDEANTYVWTDSSGTSHTGMAEPIISYSTFGITGWTAPITNRQHVTQSEALTYLAQIRAAEASFYGNHPRPNGNDGLDGNFSGVSWGGEALAWNFTTIAGNTAWYGEMQTFVKAMKAGTTTSDSALFLSIGHYWQQINRNNTIMGIGSFKVDGSSYYAVAGEVGYVSSSSALSPVAGGHCTQSINVAVSNLNASISGADAVGVNNTTPLTATVSDNMSRNSGGKILTNLPSVSNTKWVSEKTSVASVDANTGVVTGVSVGSTTIDFYIGSTVKATKSITVKPGISSATVSAVAAQTYTGSAITPEPMVTLDGTTLTKDTDYSLAYSNNVNAGTATITITGKGSYSGTKSVTFTISKAASATSLASNWSTTYTGSGITWNGAVTVMSGTSTISSPTVTYTYSSSSTGVFTSTAPSNTGTWWVKGTFVGDANHNSSTSAPVSYKITPADIAGATVAAIADQYYTGSAVTPVPAITFAGTTLTSGTDFTLSYANNVELGTGIVTITGRGSFTGATKATFAIVEPPKPSISYYSLSSGYQGISYSSGASDYSAAEGETVTWSWVPNSGSSLPEGLSMDPSTGKVSGTPMVRGCFSVVVSVTNQYGGTTMVSTTITINDPKPVWSSSTTYNGSQGVELWWYPYFTGAGTITYSVVGSLPDGLSFNSATKGITGIPTQVGTFTATIRGTNAYGTTDQVVTFVIDDGSPKITSGYLSSGTVGDSYTSYLYASGVTPASWELASGPLPDGLSLSASGEITGTPTKAGSFPIVVKVTNAKGSDTKAFTMYISTGAPSIADSSMITYVGASLSYKIYASGNSPITFALESGSSLPPGLELSTSGSITGTPTTEGTYTFSIRATNAVASDVGAFTIKVGSGAPSLDSLYLYNDGVANTTFSQSLHANGASPMEWTWEAAPGSSIPAGLKLSKAGSITGIPTAAGTYTVKFTATNDKGSDSKTVTFTISPSVPTFTNSSIQSGTVGVQYLGSYVSARGMSPMSWTWEAEPGSSLPPGLAFSENGNISGIPTQAGTYWVKITATNAAGSTSLVTSIIINGPVTPSFFSYENLSGAVVGQTYYGSINTQNATSVTLKTGSLPDGLYLFNSPGSSYASISGVPTKKGTYTFTLVATNADGATAEREYSIVVCGDEPTITTSSALRQGVLDKSYYASLNATGDSTITWSLVSGSLPDGLSLTNSGSNNATITGAPTTTGTFTFTLKAENGISFDERTFTLEIGGGEAPVIGASSNTSEVITLNPVATGTSYSSDVYVSGSSPMKLAVSSGSLPSGLTVGKLGGGDYTISGTPTQKGDYSFTLKATNAYGSDTQAFTLHVSDGVEITTVSLPTGSPNTFYSGYLKGTGDGGTWSVSSGSLPDGLVLSYYGASYATIQGIPTRTGTFTFTMTATDGQGRSTSKQCTITIKGGAPIIETTSLDGATCFSWYYSSITASGNAPVTLKLKDGSSLPDGLTLAQSASGACNISGYPTKAGTYSFTLVATNSDGTASKDYTLVVAPSTVSLDDGAFANGNVGSTYSHSLGFMVNGKSMWNLPASNPKVVSGSLPDGLTFVVIDRAVAVSGVPTKVGTFTFTVQVTCGTTTVSKQYSMKVTGEAPQVNTTSLAAAVPGTAYEETLYASGNKPITWEVVSGMPTGLSLSSDGVISGSPSASSSGTYAVVVKASNAVGATQATLSLLVKGSKPSMPTAFTASGDLTKVNLSWAAPKWPGTSSITGYRIYRDGTLLATVPSGTTSYVDSSVNTGINYSYTVQAVNASGAGQQTEFVSARAGKIATTVTLDAGTFSPVFTGSQVRFGGTAVVKTSLGATLSSATVSYTYCSTPDGVYVATPPTSAGTWYVKGSYAGDDTYASSVSAPLGFTIGAKSIASATVSGIDDSYEYTGSALTPSPSVSLGGKALSAGADYVVSYSGNVSVGTATVTITGRGNYAGTVSATFRIKASVKRLWGDTALDTMTRIVDTAFPLGTTCDIVVLCTNDGYWDALAASGLAGIAHAPVLLTDPSSLSSQASYEISRLQPTKVIVCGGTFALHEDVARQAVAAGAPGCEEVRLSGENARGTALAIYQKGEEATGGTWSNVAFLVTSDGYWDALSVSPYAYAEGCPIFLTPKDAIDSDVADAIAGAGFSSLHVAGGTAVVSGSVVSTLSARGVASDRLWGQNAIDTSAKVAEWELANGFGADGACAATVDGYWDALTGAALCGRAHAPMLLVDPSGEHTATVSLLGKNAASVSHAYVLGGETAVPPSTEASLKTALGW